MVSRYGRRFRTTTTVNAGAARLVANTPAEDREGRKLLYGLEDVVREVSSRRVKSTLPDDDGDVIGG
jgi:hypothetical protein